MTLYLLFEQIERGRLRLDTPLAVSVNASRQAPSKLGLKPGETIEVEDAIKALVTKSANDVAVVVAENIAGSEPQFAAMMTRKAHELGMTRTVYRNASGLPNSEQVTTARDLSILGRAIQDRFPRYYAYFQTRSFTFAGKTHKNHNKLLGRVEGVDGIKTGFTNASGFNLLSNVRTEDRHVVAVVLGGRSGASRDQIMASLIERQLPRAYAGARTAPAVGETQSVRTAAVAHSGEPLRLQNAPVEVTTTSATPAVTASAPPVPPARRPLDLNSLRPVVASAAGASSTTTPSSPLRWQSGSQALPSTAQAYAPVQAPLPTARPVAPPVPVAKIEERLPAGQMVMAAAEPVEAKREVARPVASAWVIQLGATDDEGKARTILDKAKARSGRLLAGASAFTEKVSRDGTTLYRARFSGFDEADEAQNACKVLKRSGFACFATRS
jgi:D-alanyl-D-alanine carboxypeptidase